MVGRKVRAKTGRPQVQSPRPAEHPRIFVSIAAYRDSECAPTVADMFGKANRPDRVFAGICWQAIPGEDDALFPPEVRPPQCRVVEVDARETKGACWARSLVQSLWQGEEYTLQIDSHMRFEPGWDDLLLEMLAACPSERPLISTYPPDYFPPDQLNPPTVAVMVAKEFDTDGILRPAGNILAPEDVPLVPRVNPFCAAGFLFGPSAVLADVPYDPHLYFLGEEITLAVRLYTHGWDIFTPTRAVVYHDYTKRPGRRRHWDDNGHWIRINQLSLARIRHLLEMEETDDPEALLQIDRYGLGRRRSLAEFQAFSGVDFRNRLINGKTTDELEAARPEPERRARVKEAFTDIWTRNAWGSEETRSGDGASLARTEAIRAALPGLLDFLGIRILADAGCGEFNWMGDVAAGLRMYLGYDVADPLVADLRGKHGGRRGHFFTGADIVHDVLAEADAILCRDVLTHLPHWMVQAALARFRESGSRYLIATTHPGGENRVIRLGDWHAVNLEAPPFSLPPPRLLLDEKLPGSVKSLGVWRLADL